MTSGVPGRPLAPSMRVLLWIEALLAATAGFQLLVLAPYTDRFFAWTIQPALTAAFLGASYWGAVPLALLAARTRNWAEARIAVFGVLVFDVLTLVTTLLHLDRFHLDAAGLLPRLAAWGWLVVYVVLPIAASVLVVLQLRVPGGEPPRRMVQSRWFRAAVGLLATAAGATGVALFVAPGALAWPWRLTELTSQALGPWFVGIAVILAQVVWENDWKRVRVALVAMAVLGALYLVVLLGYASELDWSKPLAAGLVVFALALLAAGAWGWRASRRAGSILTAVG